MKIARSITIDLTIWSEFVAKVENGKYSSVIQDLIKAYSFNKDIKSDDVKALRNKQTKAIAQIIKLNKRIKQLEEEVKKEKENEEVFYSSKVNLPPRNPLRPY